jgi:exosortase/archaeosortase
MDEMISEYGGTVMLLIVGGTLLKILVELLNVITGGA